MFLVVKNLFFPCAHAPLLLSNFCLCKLSPIVANFDILSEATCHWVCRWEILHPHHCCDSEDELRNYKLKIECFFIFLFKTLEAGTISTTNGDDDKNDDKAIAVTINEEEGAAMNNGEGGGDKEERTPPSPMKKKQ